MQQILGVFLNDDIDRIQQSLQVAFLDERRTEIGHNEISHEQHTLVWQFDEQGIGRLPSLYRNKPNSRSTDIHLGGMVNQDIRLETAQVIHFEAFAEEMPAEIARRVEFFG